MAEQWQEIIIIIIERVINIKVSLSRKKTSRTLRQSTFQKKNCAAQIQYRVS